MMRGLRVGKKTRFSPLAKRGISKDVGTHRMRPSAYVCRLTHSGGVVGGVGDEGGGHREVYFTCL